MSRTDTDSETTVTSQTDETVETEPTKADTAKTDTAKTDTAKTGADAKAEPVAKDENAESASKPAATGRRSLVLPIVLAALVLVSAVGVGVLGWTALSNRNTERDQNAALAAAKTDIAQVLSYDAKTLDADLARSRKLISGDFAARFEELANLVIVPASKQQGLVTKAEVVRAALLDPGKDAQPDSVQALLFVKQSTSSNAQPQPSVGVNQLKATLTRTNGQWLISNVEPL